MHKLPLSHTSARRGAVLGAVLVGLASAVVLAAIAAFSSVGFGIMAAIAFGLGVGAVYGGVFGAIAYSTWPAPFIRHQLPELDQGRALLVCDVDEQARAKRAVQTLLERPNLCALEQ